MKRIFIMIGFMVLLSVQSVFAASSSDYLLLSKWLLGYNVMPSGVFGQVSPIWSGIYYKNMQPGVNYPVQLKPVYAVCDGKVISSIGGTTGLISIYSNKVDKSFIYLHLNSRFVYTNDNVTQGQLIGVSGKMAPYSIPYQLHFEVRDKQQIYAATRYEYALDPFYWSQQARSPI